MSTTPTSPESLIEIRIIGTLCARLKQAGWTPAWIDTGDEDENGGWIPVRGPKAVKAEFASIGMATVRFRHPASQNQSVFLVGGNGVDLIADWTYTDGDPDGFNAAMDRITDYISEAYDR